MSCNPFSFLATTRPPSDGRQNILGGASDGMYHPRPIYPGEPAAQVLARGSHIEFLHNNGAHIPVLPSQRGTPTTSPFQQTSTDRPVAPQTMAHPSHVSDTHLAAPHRGEIANTRPAPTEWHQHLPYPPPVRVITLRGGKKELMPFYLQVSPLPTVRQPGSVAQPEYPNMPAPQRHEELNLKINTHQHPEQSDIDVDIPEQPVLEPRRPTPYAPVVLFRQARIPGGYESEELSEGSDLPVS
jgi:hypothetical protein